MRQCDVKVVAFFFLLSACCCAKAFALERIIPSSDGSHFVGADSGEPFSRDCERKG